MLIIKNKNKFKIVTSSFCGTLTPCSAYFTKYPFAVPLSTIHTWNFNVSLGYNKLSFTQPVLVTKGSLVLLIQSTAKVGIDKNGTSLYSDMLVNNGAYYKLNETSNWRFFFNSLISFSSYVSNLYLTHQYLSTGFYEIAVTFASSMAVFRHTIQINQCKIFKIF